MALFGHFGENLKIFKQPMVSTATNTPKPARVTISAGIIHIFQTAT
jgi:hypothetical protein